MHLFGFSTDRSSLIEPQATQLRKQANMKIRSLFFLVLLLALALFSVLNWSAFIAPTTLSLGFAIVQAPLGLVMLGLLACFATIFLVFALYLQTTSLLETRRHARELEANRTLANQAETSRFTELRTLLEAALKRQVELDAESRAALTDRLDKLDRDFRYTIEETGNTFTAYIGELEDRLERNGIGKAPQTPN